MPGSPRPEPRRLAAFVQAEAQRALSEAQLAADPARTAAGWERRFVIEGPRVPELLALYEELGYEAVADPLPEGTARAPGEAPPGEAPPAEGCDVCLLAGAMRFHMIYTRRRDPRGERRG